MHTSPQVLTQHLFLATGPARGALKGAFALASRAKFTGRAQLYHLPVRKLNPLD